MPSSSRIISEMLPQMHIMGKCYSFSINLILCLFIFLTHAYKHVSDQTAWIYGDLSIFNLTTIPRNAESHLSALCHKTELNAKTSNKV